MIFPAAMRPGLYPFVRLQAKEFSLPCLFFCLSGLFCMGQYAQFLCIIHHFMHKCSFMQNENFF